MSACPVLHEDEALTPVLLGVSKRFGGRAVLQTVSLNLASHGITCLLGPSGCGKSTLLRIAAGLLPADTGSVFPDPRACAMVFQEPRLLPWLTVEENLALALPPYPATQRRQALLNALHKVELGDIRQHLPAELSGGMAQRVGLARALLRRPQFLLMDEPFAALDAITRATLQQMLVTLVAEQGIACLFVTHDINEALLIGNHIHVLQNGTISFSADAGTSGTRCHHTSIKQQIVACLHKP